MALPDDRHIILIAHNLRSTHNVGSLLRTAEGLGATTVYLTGYTPYPHAPHDSRLPHEAAKIDKQIQKTALGAEKLAAWKHEADIFAVIKGLSTRGYKVYALEQAHGSLPLPEFQPPPKTALIVGRETEGIEPEVLAKTAGILEIPMFGRKESFNVVQAAAMALYHCRFSA